MIWIIGAVLFLILVVLVVSFVCYRMAFYAGKKEEKDPEKIEIPIGEIYEVFRPQMEQWVLETRALPCKKYSIRSFDGLTLHGTYYECTPGAPMELMFHGYRGSAQRDLPGGVQRCFALGRNVLLVDQRCSGDSEGKTITFGIYEHRDCLAWVDFAVKEFGPEVKIILTGISMGAATVMLAAGQKLPPNVIGVLADCGYTSAKEIIQVVIRQMGLPPKLGYPFVKLGARLFGHFDPEADSPEEAMKRSSVPVIFFHGEDDAFVPCDMSRRCYAACASPKKRLVTIPGAGHGLCYPVAPEQYLEALREFF